jgi:hypothetical protein
MSNKAIPSRQRGKGGTTRHAAVGKKRGLGGAASAPSNAKKAKNGGTHVKEADASSSGSEEKEEDEVASILDQVESCAAVQKASETETVLGVQASNDALRMLALMPAVANVTIKVSGWDWIDAVDESVSSLFVLKDAAKLAKKDALISLRQITGIDTTKGGSSKGGTWSADETKDAIHIVLLVSAQDHHTASRVKGHTPPRHFNTVIQQ